MTKADHATDRTVLRVTGQDRRDFLQGLISNDINKLADGLVYAALLTPQGKYLADFFLLERDDAILIDVQSTLAASLTQRLSMYKLRADVQISATDIPVYRGLDPFDAPTDPRHPALGWRHYGALDCTPANTDWNALRVAHLIPETGAELIANDSYILEHHFEPLNGVDFKKGCYVGQEVTARMKHKTELRKGLARVRITGQAAQGTEITANGKPVGTLFTQSGNHALAYLRFDRAGPDMQAGTARLSYPA